MKREFCFYKASGEKNTDGQSEKLEYNVRLTFEDKTEAVLHNFPFEDMTKAEIHMEDEVVYLTYTSSSTKAPVSTKAAEMMASAEETAAPTPTPVPVENTNSVQNSKKSGETKILLMIMITILEEVPAEEVPAEEVLAEEVPAEEMLEEETPVTVR